MVRNLKELDDIKNSIKKLNDFSSKEKVSLIDSIEMLWLNAGIQKKKKDIKLDNDKSKDYCNYVIKKGL